MIGPNNKDDAGVPSPSCPFMEIRGFDVGATPLPLVVGSSPFTRPVPVDTGLRRWCAKAMLTGQRRSRQAAAHLVPWAAAYIKIVDYGGGSR